MRIRDRVELYKRIFKNSAAIEPVKTILESGWEMVAGWDRIELLRKLNTELSDAYQVSLPVITVWVRDNSYVQETEEIYLCEPDLEGFLHEFRHHLQNVERKYERRGLTDDSGSGKYYKLPYEDTVYKMYGEDDARAWAKFIIEVAQGI